MLGLKCLLQENMQVAIIVVGCNGGNGRSSELRCTSCASILNKHLQSHDRHTPMYRWYQGQGHIPQLCLELRRQLTSWTARQPIRVPRNLCDPSFAKLSNGGHEAQESILFRCWLQWTDKVQCTCLTSRQQRSSRCWACRATGAPQFLQPAFAAALRFQPVQQAA